MKQNLLICVEESDSTVGFYDTSNGAEIARVKVGKWPHEIALTRDGKTAFVSNFGIKDYDENIGFAGASISIIDVENKVEIDRLYTFRNKADYEKYRGPHGLVLSPDEKKLYVNVESQDTLLEFDLTQKSGVCNPATPYCYNFINTDYDSQPDAFSALPKATHAMIFSQDGSRLWVVSGRGGVSEIDIATKTQLRTFYCKGAIRGLTYSQDTTQLIASASGEVAFIDPETLRIVKRFEVPGIKQFLYSKQTSDEKYLICPAVWEGQIVRIDIKSGQIDRLIVGSDPIHVVMEAGSERAYISHGRSKHVTVIDWKKFVVIDKIKTQGGPNGLCLTNFSDRPTREILKFGAVLPLSSKPDGKGSSAEGQDLRLGYQYWAECVNDAGGILANGIVYDVDVVFEDSQSQTGVDPSDRGAWLKPYTERDPPEMTRVEALTKKLITQDNVQYFFGGYPSPPNLLSARIAGDSRRPLITSSGAAGIMYEQGLKNFFGIMTSANGFLNDTFTYLTRIDSPPKTVVFWACNDPAATQDAVTTAQFITNDLGMTVLSSPASKLPRGDMGVYQLDHLTSDFESLVKETKVLNPDVLAITGHLPESISAVKDLRRMGLTPKAIVFSVGPGFPQFAQQLGSASENLSGASMWSHSQTSFGHDRYILPQHFADHFFDRFSKKVSYLAAGAFACGLVYEEAIRRANSVDPSMVIKALSKPDFIFETFYSRIEFNRKGLNINRPLLTVQLQSDGKDVRQVALWPPELASEGEFRWPFPGWSK